MVTILADNYYGYCKKEVKTQISFAANLFGMCEEEHAGGAIAFATYVLGQEFHAGRTVSLKKAKYSDAIGLLGDLAEPRPEGYAKDKRFSDIYYVPEDAVFNVLDGTITWRQARSRRAPHAAQRCHVLPAVRISHPSGEANRRNGLATGRRAAARNAVPQAVHGVGRRQIGDFEVDRQRAAEGSGVRQGLSSRHGPGGRDFRARFFRGSTGSAFPTRGRGGRS